MKQLVRSSALANRRGAAQAIRPVSGAERDARATANGGEPTLDRDGQVPYDAYVRASTLHGLQRPLSGDPGEMSFLMISQIMELYFKLCCFELGTAQRLLRDDDLAAALRPLKRAALHLEGLNAAWRGLSWMTPTDFNRFRDLLGEGSGFQSAMYRQLTFRLGLKDAAMVRPFRRAGQQYTELLEALRAPSLWDDVLALLGRRGFPLPQVVDRDHSVRYAPQSTVEAAWVEIYRDDRPDNQLRALGEALAEIADRFDGWRQAHVTMVRRTMGEKVGSGGSAGLAWLRRGLSEPVFPELWSARTAL